MHFIFLRENLCLNRKHLNTDRGCMEIKNTKKGESPLLDLHMRKALIALLLCLLISIPVFASGSDESSSSDSFPPGEIVAWATGQPQFKQPYYQAYIDSQGERTEGITLRYEAFPTQADSQQRLIMYSMAGDNSSLPEFMPLDAVGLVELAKAGLLRDQTEYFEAQADQYLDGVVNDATVDGKIWGLPDSVKPQLLFYNNAIFEKYDVDPEMMKTFEGYLEAGKLLKERSNGEVYLSWIDTTTYTWRYWGRRGLMPQTGARIWDENGNVVIGEDEGTKIALGYLAELYNEGLLFRSTMMQPPLFEAADDGKIATFYIGAFFDEFLRKNLVDTAGDWRAMAAPVFEDIGLAGAPISQYFCIVDTGTNEYEDLCREIWWDSQNNIEAIKKKVTELEAINGAYDNPVSKASLADPFWSEPSDFYGGQSFRQIQTDGLQNVSKNLVVTPQDAQADNIISEELEKFVAGEQTIEQAIANMDKELKLQIGQAEV